MKNKKILILIIGIAIIILIAIFIKKTYKNIKTGNNIINKSADQINEYILNIESYQAIAKITIKSNKNENTYIVKQKYTKQGNMYSQEILEPENIKGIQFIYDGTNLKIENAKIKLSKIYENYNYVGSNELSLVAFIEDYKNSNNSSSTEQNGEIILVAEKNENNKYTMSKKLYINKETGTIEKLEINDRTQNIRIYILYNEIEVNETTQEEVVAFSFKTVDDNI